MNTFTMIRHLLPRARAWRLTIDKNLRAFFSGLGAALDPVRVYIDATYRDVFPDSTRQIPDWEEQFGLTAVSLTEAQRRARLAVAWQPSGGQSPRYIQDTLRGNGFAVFVHDWWVPGSEPPVGSKSCVPARNPLLVLRRDPNVGRFSVGCGEPMAQCGESFAQAGRSNQNAGYALVNNVAGVVYIVPDDTDKWPHFLYIGGAEFGDLAEVPPERRDEFETLCLKICPAQLWLGMLVTYPSV